MDPELSAAAVLPNEEEGGDIIAPVAAHQDVPEDVPGLPYVDEDEGIDEDIDIENEGELELLQLILQGLELSAHIEEARQGLLESIERGVLTASGDSQAPLMRQLDSSLCRTITMVHKLELSLSIMRSPA
jgi:hypothetical protein